MTEKNTEEAIRRRHAIQLALTDTLEPDQVQAALRLWDTQFSSARPTQIIDFVSEVAVLLDLAPRRRHDLRLALYQFILKCDSEPTPAIEPIRPLAAPTRTSTPATPDRAAPAQTPTVSPAWTVFAAIVSHIRDGVLAEGRSATQEFIHSLKQQKRGLRAPAALHGLLVGWSSGEGSLAGCSEAKEKDLAHLVHAVYVAAAEALGPVNADRLLAASIASAESMPEARAFPPKRFL